MGCSEKGVVSGGLCPPGRLCPGALTQDGSGQVVRIGKGAPGGDVGGVKKARRMGHEQKRLGLRPRSWEFGDRSEAPGWQA